MRIEKGLTQEELANRCELSKGFISQLENDLTSPSIATLIDILEILGTNLKEFFSDDRDEKITYTYEDMFETENEELKYSLMWLVPNAQKNMMEPIMITLKPGGQYLEEDPHEGEEFGFVLSGNITLHLGDTKHKVKKGESFYFKPKANHYISNNGKTKQTKAVRSFLYRYPLFYILLVNTCYSIDNILVFVSRKDNVIFENILNAKKTSWIY